MQIILKYTGIKKGSRENMKFQSCIFVIGKNIFLLANVSFIFLDIYKIRGSMCLN